MDEDEAALLAELRAISNKSAASRFMDEQQDVVEQHQEHRSPPLSDRENEEYNDEEDDDVLDELLADDDNDDVFHDTQTGTTPNAKGRGGELKDISSKDGFREDKKDEQADIAATTNFKQTSTFQGERGGAAEDAELLALLRGVSAKSGAADRFAEDNSENNGTTESAVPRKEEQPLPPWKRKAKAPVAASSSSSPKMQDDVVIVAAAAPCKPAVEQSPKEPALVEEPPQSSQEVMLGGGGNFKQESTFQGERGGAAEDAELLALLRGVSAKSSSADRFADSDDLPPAPAPAPKANAGSAVPPWKRGKVQQAAAVEPVEDVVVITAPPAPPAAVASEEPIMGGGGNFKQESTFQGERGGAAEDAELLALLRGVSAKSSADRFADEADLPPAPAPAPKTKPAAPKTNAGSAVPPWKRGNTQKPAAVEPMEEVVVLAAPAPSEEPIMGGGGNFKQESTFQGERGGAAEDAELLALLRGVSAKSSADRFADDADLPPAPAPAPKPKPVAPKTNAGPAVPPWKRGSVQQASEEPMADVVLVAAPPAPPAAVPSEEPIMGSGGNFKQESTFQGERGGAAEDAELLALLRGVSAKSSADRFADEADLPPAAAPKPRPAPPKPAAEVNTAVFGGAGNFKQESTFQGERGGAAEDEELLALLRGVSARSGGTDRFAQEGEGPLAPPSGTHSPAKVEPSMSAIPPASPAGEDEIEVTRDKLPEYVNHSNWKVRKDSYALLRTIILEQSQGREPMGELSGDAILPGLDGQISGYLMDKNATALEEALQLAEAYADYCQGGASAELAEAMAVNLITGGGFTSPRPKASKAAQALAIKLMEVGNGTTSVNAVIGVLLDQGLSSRKPKVVEMSARLILEAAHAFGAGCLPLAAIKQSLPQMLSHSNKKVRDLGLEVLAELCRALGGKSALGDVIEEMKKPQVKELDTMLEKRAEPSKITIGLRSLRSSSGAGGVAVEDAMAALQANAAELAAERYANRPAVDLPAEVRKSEYAEHLKLAKWSEKVAGLKIILDCGGEKPYKLMPPSAHVNYAPLIGEMKGLLAHTHFAVVGKALEVLSMLAEGAGERLYPNLRPLLPKLFTLSKDKKLTSSVSSCLDAFFGNVLSFDHILDAEAAIPEAIDERKEKNALARCTALDFLERCVSRGENAGPRGALVPSTAKQAAQLCSDSLGDSDASVRKSALNVLKTLMNVDDEQIQHVVRSVVAHLETSNPRAFKQLGSAPAPPRTTGITAPSPAASPVKPKQRPSKIIASSPALAAHVKGSPVARAEPPKRAQSRPPPASSGMPSDFVAGQNFTKEEATEYVAALGIPLWDAEDEDGGVLAGLISTKWLFRQNAIKAIAAFVNDRDVPDTPEALQNDSAHILVLVKEHTRAFQETNVNVARSVMELFLALCDCHENQSCPIPTWAARDMTTLACSKIAEKKLSPMSKSLLLSLCVVQVPHMILGQAFATMTQIKSPVAQEEFLHWMKSFAMEFGAGAIGPGLNDTVVFLFEHCDSKNVKVKKAALGVMGKFHVQLGPAFEALVFSSVKDESLRDQLQKTFSEHAYDPTTSKSDFPKHSIVATQKGGGSNNTCGDVFELEMPKLDLLAELPADCLARMCSKESKTSWKARKEAMEEVEAVLKRCAGLLDTSKLRPLVDVLRALRERLSDSQSNLKPVAARLIGSILSATDAPSQAKLGKVVYGPLINAAMNDSRKVMHDACMEALSVGTSLPKFEGGGLNELSMEPFIVSLVGELDESDFKSGGIPDVLDLARSFAGKLPDLDGVASQGGDTLASRLAKVLVKGLSSSKVEIRSSSENLLLDCVKNGTMGVASVKKVASRQKPAIQRAIAPVIAKLSSPVSAADDANNTPNSEFEDDEDVVAPTTQKSVLREPKASTGIPVRQHPSRAKPDDAGSTRRADAEVVPASPRSPRRNTTVSHPLVAVAGLSGQQKSKAGVRSMTWPEYPEEPSGNLVLNALKKAWSPLIPPESTKSLFPDGGIKKQDDAMGGFELLTRAIVMERAGEGCAIGEQFSFIWKWMTFVLCCKESTVGLQALLQLASDLIDHLRSISYELSDSEATVFVPHLFDKASAAKGRFKDTFFDLMEQIKAEELLPAKRLGPLVCVAVIEGSSHPKARLLACKECHICVEKIGLSGIGKRGVLAAAKALSDEKLQENRAAFLDLMVLLVQRMNNDMQRFTRICGASLSGKARSLIEEQLSKGEVDPPSGIPKSNLTRPSPRRESQIRRSSNAQQISTRTTPSKLPVMRSKPTATSTPSSAKETEANADFQDELPALDLRLGARSTPNAAAVSSFPSDRFDESQRAPSPSPPNSSPVGAVDESFNEDDQTRSRATAPLQEEKDGVRSALFSSSSSLPESSDTDSLGAAASLRARLMKIRERNKSVNGSISAPNSGDAESPQGSAKVSTNQWFSGGASDGDSNVNSENAPETASGSQADNSFEEFVDLPSSPAGHLDRFLDTIKRVLSRTVPLAEEDDDIIESTDVLKSLHAAVSKQANLAVNLDAAAVSHLRMEIKENANEVVETLTRLIGFGFECHDVDCNGGMSIPLLSVNLATLMAIFRSDDISKRVRVEDLTMLIKEAGKALLDPRLASSSPSNALDEATSTQMVRAINKLAVQAATGAARHTSFEALMTLQQQLCLKADGDPVFNSRLSRVVTKLFARVVKAEESSQQPFSPSSVDMEAVVCFLEDALVACRDTDEREIAGEAIAATRNLSKVLVTAMLKAHGETETLRSQMEALEIDSVESSLGQLVLSCASEMGLSNAANVSKESAASRDVSALVSAVGEAPMGPEREAAVAALRDYKAEYGDEELNNHLKDVSAAFRAFILEQLSGATRSDDQERAMPNSMSERIKSIRSKLNATEAVVQSAVDQGDSLSSMRASTYAAPEAATPAASSTNVRAFRERLAAAQEKRTFSTTSASNEIQEDSTSSAGSRAAALRARLQAVKRQASQTEY